MEYKVSCQYVIRKGANEHVIYRSGKNTEYLWEMYFVEMG